MTHTTEAVAANVRNALNEETADYALELIEAGFTVYLPTGGGLRRRQGEGWFHYSRTVDGRECYGTYHDGRESFDGPNHSMPLVPSRLNGSGATVGARWGDADTLGMDALDVRSVEYARIVARPENWCPYNAEPTPEAVRAAQSNAGTPKRFYQGATLANARPWGLDSGHYVAAELFSA
jgi:hypothetical protein